MVLRGDSGEFGLVLVSVESQGTEQGAESGLFCWHFDPGRPCDLVRRGLYLHAIGSAGVLTTLTDHDRAELAAPWDGGVSQKMPLGQEGDSSRDPDVLILRLRAIAVVPPRSFELLDLVDQAMSIHPDADADVRRMADRRGEGETDGIHGACGCRLLGPTFTRTVHAGSGSLLPEDR